jgi:hypothetical protein
VLPGSGFAGHAHGDALDVPAAPGRADQVGLEHHVHARVRHHAIEGDLQGFGVKDHVDGMGGVRRRHRVQAAQPRQDLVSDSEYDLSRGLPAAGQVQPAVGGDTSQRGGPAEK